MPPVILSWEGRELKSYNDEANGNYYSYTYNADGIRTSKYVNGTTHEYYLDGSRIIGEYVSTGYLYMYMYDENGSPIGIKFRRGDYAQNEYDYFFFEKNLQGDIVAIYNSQGTKIGSYTYDAWGNVTVTTHTSGIEATVVRNNPFRYRGYYYDSETGWYYLQSRYYNPTWGRFINADGYVSTGTGIIGYNMFAYCDNNPVMKVDYTGEVGFFEVLAKIAKVVVATVVTTAAVNIYAVVESNIYVKNSDVEAMEAEEYKRISKADDTTGLSREEKLSYIRAFRLDEDNKRKCENWSEAQMLREYEYHDKGFKLAVLFGSDPDIEDSVADRFQHVDFEENQTIGTYVKRYIGNLFKIIPIS